MTDYLEELNKLYSKIFDPIVVNTFISEKIGHLNSNTEDIEKLFNKKYYERYIEKEADVFKIRGCLRCIKDLRITIRQQDFPGWIGDIRKCDIMIIGLEAKLGDPDMDVHIAYDHYPGGPMHDLFKKYSRFIPNIKDRSYITDIAKCTSSDFGKSRYHCFRIYFLKEIEFFLKINPQTIILFQGAKVEEFFMKKDNKKIFKIQYDFELKGKRSMLFKTGILKYLDFKVPLLYFPHTSGSNTPEWKEIQENRSKEIKNRLKSLKL